MRAFLSWLLILCTCMSAFAQNDADTITRQAADGIDLVADFHAADEGAPVVIALHMLNSNRAAWTPLLPDLHEAGYAVLNMDMRGHGDSGGTRDWDTIIADVAGWVAWLDENGHLSADGFATMGGSIGANVALISCADIEACRGAIALSPGLDYKATKPLPALESGMTALLMAAHGDRYSAESLRELFAGAAGDVTARILPGRAHGTRLFDGDYEAASGMILAWLGEHLSAIADSS